MLCQTAIRSQQLDCAHICDSCYSKLKPYIDALSAEKDMEYTDDPMQAGKIIK
jgi:hypothetical protein